MNQQITEMGQRIRAQRKQLGLSLHETARQANLSSGYLCQIEKGKYAPSVPIAQRLAKTLGMRPQVLILPASRKRGRRSGTRLELLAYLNRYFAEKGYMPAIREIMEDMNFSSTSAVNYALDQMEDWGWISRDRDVARGIRLHEVDNMQSISRELARLRQAVVQADPTCLQDGRFEQMAGSPQTTLEVAAALLGANRSCAID